MQGIWEERLDFAWNKYYNRDSVQMVGDACHTGIRDKWEDII